MAGIVAQHEKDEIDKELAELLTRLTKAELITDANALGICRQVIARGRESLSNKQEYVFKTEVYDQFCDISCERCGTKLSYNEAWDLELGDSAEFCSGCKHDYAKLMRD